MPPSRPLSLGMDFPVILLRSSASICNSSGVLSAQANRMRPVTTSLSSGVIRWSDRKKDEARLSTKDRARSSSTTSSREYSRSKSGGKYSDRGALPSFLTINSTSSAGDVVSKSMYLTVSNNPGRGVLSNLAGKIYSPFSSIARACAPLSSVVGQTLAEYSWDTKMTQYRHPC